MIGTQELIIILALVLLLFGASKLPELARSMGKSIGEFKKARIESEKEIKHWFKDNELIDYFSKQKSAKMVYLYGSAAKGMAGKLSDVDIGVLLDESLSKKDRFDLQLKFIGDISEILGTDRIDLVIMNDVPNSLNYEIIKTNPPLFISDSILKMDFEQMVLSRYLDRRYYEKRAASEFLKKVAVKGI